MMVRHAYVYKIVNMNLKDILRSFKYMRERYIYLCSAYLADVIQNIESYNDIDEFLKETNWKSLSAKDLLNITNYLEYEMFIGSSSPFNIKASLNLSVTEEDIFFIPHFFSNIYFDDLISSSFPADTLIKVDSRDFYSYAFTFDEIFLSKHDLEYNLVHLDDIFDVVCRVRDRLEKNKIH